MKKIIDFKIGQSGGDHKIAAYLSYREKKEKTLISIFDDTI